MASVMTIVALLLQQITLACCLGDAAATCGADSTGGNCPAAAVGSDLPQTIPEDLPGKSGFSSLIQLQGEQVRATANLSQDPATMVAYWRFEEPYGSRTVTDDSGFGHTLTMRRWGNHQHPFAEIEVGQGLAGSSAVRFFSRSFVSAVVPPFRTFAMWVKRDPGCCWRIKNWASAQRADGSSYFGLILHKNVVKATVSTAGGLHQAAAFPLEPAAEDEGWIHIAAAWDEDLMYIYLNGEFKGKSNGKAGSAFTSSGLGEGDLTFTVGTGGPHWMFVGNTDDVRLYSGKLDEAAIAALAAGESNGGLMAGEAAPVRASAPAQTVWKPADGGAFTVQLAGACTDGATAAWEVESAPGGAASPTFGSPASASTSLDFAASAAVGDYILTLSCTGGSMKATAESVVAVFEPHKADPDAKIVRNEGQPLNLPGVEGTDATPIMLYAFDGDTANAGKGSQALEFYSVRGTGQTYEFVTDAKFGQALKISCSDQNCQQLDLGNFESADSISPAMSVSCWFKSDKPSKLAFIIKGSFPMETPDLSGWKAGEWRHYAVVLDEKIEKAYLDGKLIKIGPGRARTEADASDKMTFGIRAGTHASYGFEGIVDELAVFDYALSNDEVEILRTKGASGLKTRPQGNPYNRGDYALSIVEKFFETPSLGEEKAVVDAFQKDSAAPYVHPRIFFTPDELPALREKFTNTVSGRLAMHNIRSLIDYYYPADDLAVRNYSLSELYWFRDSNAYLVQYFILQSFKCIIDADRPTAVRLGQQMDSLADEIKPYIESKLPLTWGLYDETDFWQNHTYDAVLRTGMAFMYDFLYPYLQVGTRNKVRGVLSLATTNTWAIGMDAVPAFRALTSNWVPWVTGDLVLNLMAIEGEDGFDEGVYERAVKMFDGWTTLGVSKLSGALFEGGGKNALVGTKLITLAKHGHAKYLAAKGPKLYASDHLIHMMLPSHRFFEEDLWGGSENRIQPGDVLGMKVAHPGNKVIDYVYRRAIRGHVTGLTNEHREYDELAPGRTTHYAYNNHLLNVIFAEDFTGPEDVEAHEKHATAGLPLSYFAKDVGIMTARTAWADKDAAWFALDMRSLEGGHVARARGTFIFYALGENWAFYNTGHNTDSMSHNIVIADGKGQSIAPGKVEAFLDAPEATWASVNTLYGYSAANWTSQSPNYYMLEKGPYPWMDFPISELPSWWRGVDKRPSLNKKDEETGSITDFQKAFRTGGLVRSGPAGGYAVILDDFQKHPTSKFWYEWRMTLPFRKHIWNSVMYKPTYERINRCAVAANGKDLVLEGAYTTARLLVRVLDGSTDSNFAMGIKDCRGLAPRLQVDVEAVLARFRVLLYPMREGDKLPTTAFDEGSGILDITHGDGTSDQIKLEVTEEGMTKVASMKANGKAVILAQGSAQGPPAAAEEEEASAQDSVLRLHAELGEF